MVAFSKVLTECVVKSREIIDHREWLKMAEKKEREYKEEYDGNVTKSQRPTMYRKTERQSACKN